MKRLLLITLSIVLALSLHGQTVKKFPFSTQTALNAKENSITAGTALQYYRGDKTWQTFPGITPVTKNYIDSINTVLTIKAATFGYSIYSITENFIVQNYSLRRSGNVCNLTIKFDYNGPAGWSRLCMIPSPVFPTSPVYGSCGSQNLTLNYTGSAEVSVDGSVELYLKGSPAYYSLNLTWIIF